MKKVLAVALIAVMAMGALAFAGPYFTLENDGATIAPTLILGADFSVSLPSDMVQSAPRVFGDANFALPDNDLDASIGVGFAGIQAEVGALLDFNKNYKLDEWDTSFTITGYPFSGIKVWCGVSFNYDPTVPVTIPVTPNWTLVPVFGIEGRW